MYAIVFLVSYLISYCNPFIIPNELPSVLSVLYSNIPPVKLGFDTRFGLGFRLGPHADYQTLIEIGPQTNTNPLSPNATVAKRQSNTLKRLHRLNNGVPKKELRKVDESRQKEVTKPKKSEKTLVGKIEFKKVPGIDDDITRQVKKPQKIVKGNSESEPTKFVLLR